MKQRFLHVLLSALCLTFLFSSALRASDTQVDGIWYSFNDSEQTASVTYRGSYFGSYDNEYSGSVVIPETVNYNGKIYSVTSIVDYAFFGCSSLTSVTIGNSVTSIGDDAFCDCSSLTSITIPNSVTSIGVRAFDDCSSLTSVTIPNSVTSIGSCVFKGCKRLTQVVWNVKKINDASCSTLFHYYSYNSIYNFDLRSQITSFIIGDEVEYIPANLCSGMTKLKSVTIPNSVTSIGNYAFYGCSGLTSVTIPNSVTSIGDYAFYGCSDLTSITIPNSVTSIGDYAFSNCSGLPVIENVRYADTYLVEVVDKTLSNYAIKEGTKYIGNYAFSDCSSLTSVTIPNSVTSIGSYAFKGCDGLTEVHISDVDAWCKISFGSLDANPLYYVHNLYLNGELVTDLFIPNSVTSIGSSAFSGCSGLTSITIPNSVTSIGSSAFSGCSGLTSIAIPNSVTSIGSSAFSGCSGLTSITIPNSVTSIGNYAFSDCKIDKIYFTGTMEEWVGKSWSPGNISSSYSLYINNSLVTNAVIPNSVTSIGNYAFYGCSGLTSVTIPNNVTSIGASAFSGCSITSVVWNAKNCNSYNFGSQVESFTFGDKVEVIPNGICRSMTKLTSITIPYGVISIGEQAFYDCSRLTSVTIPSSVTSIGDNAFFICSSLTAVFISNMAAWCKRSFGNDYANPLYYAHNLYLYGELVTDLIIPNSVTSIGNYAFDGCSSLTSVTIPNSVTSIGSSAFYGCSRLTSIEIPNSVTSIGGFAFGNCSGLTSVTIGSSVTNIVKNTFQYCSGITSVVWNAINCNGYNFGSQVESFIFGDKVEVIPASICSGMKKLTSITIPTSVTSIGKDAFLDCSGLTSIVWNAKNCNYDYVPFYAIRQLITSFTLGENVETIPGKLCYEMDQLTSITFPNSLTSIKHNAFNGCSSLTSVTIPNSVTSIENNAFYGCKGMQFLSLGEGITSYGNYVFQGCSALTTIYNYRERPAKLGTDVFKDVDYFNCTLHVLAGSVDMYKSAGSDWKDFYFVEPIGAASTTTEKVEITPTDNTAGFVWPTVNNAASYELVIKDKQGNDVCTLIFDAQGHLTQIAFAAPDRNRAPEQTAEQVAGFSFTITGLNSGTTYNYTITSKDSNGNTLDTKTGTFRTQGGTATTYTLTVYSADATMGTVSGSGEYEEGDEVTLTATPADCYRFVRWSDNNTDNPRTIVLTEDMTLTAYFERIPDALEETDTDRTPSATKVFENGQLYILLPNGTRYNLQGMEIK